MSNFSPKKWSGSLGTLQESNTAKSLGGSFIPPLQPLHHGWGMIACISHQNTKQKQQNTHTLCNLKTFVSSFRLL